MATQLWWDAIDKDLVLLVELALALRLGGAATAMREATLPRHGTRRTHSQGCSSLGR